MFQYVYTGIFKWILYETILRSKGESKRVHEVSSQTNNPGEKRQARNAACRNLEGGKNRESG